MTRIGAAASQILVVSILLCGIALGADPSSGTFHGLLPQVTLPGGEDHVTLPLTRAWNLFVTRAKVNGKDVGWFLVDTGSTGMGVDSSVAKSLALTTVARHETTFIHSSGSINMAVVDGIDIGPVHISQTVASELDLSGFTKLLGFRLAGLIGSDLFRAQPCLIDFRSAQLILYDRAHFKPPPFPSYPMRVTDTGRILISATVAKKAEALFQLDSGNSSGLMLASPYLRLHPRIIDESCSVGSDAFDMNGGYTTGSAPLAEFAALGHIWPSTDAEFEPSDATADHRPAAGIIGMMLLSDVRLTFDYEREQIWAQWLEPESAQALLDRLGDPHSLDLCGVSPLLRAIVAERADVALPLIERGADVNAATAFGDTPLIRASGQPEVVKALISHGAKVNAVRPGDGDTALLSAAYHANRQTIELLTRFGGDITALDSRGHTALFLAVKKNAIEAVKALLLAGADPRTPDAAGRTPLNEAAKHRDAEMLTLLLDHGLKVNETDKFGVTPLHVAANVDSRDAVQLLLARGAAVNAVASGTTPLMLAAKQRNAEIVKMLLGAGADPTMTDNELKTAADLANSVGAGDVLKLLLFTKAKKEPKR